MKTIDQISCPHCGNKTLFFEIIPEYEARMNKISFNVPNAKICKCSSCKMTIVEAKELHRWADFKAMHLNANKIPTLTRKDFKNIEGFYICRVTPTREYRIQKINKLRWEWSEWESFGGFPSKNFTRSCKTLTFCINAVNHDNQPKMAQGLANAG